MPSQNPRRATHFCLSSLNSCSLIDPFCHHSNMLYFPSSNKIREPIPILLYFHIFLLPSQENFLSWLRSYCFDSLFSHLTCSLTCSDESWSPCSTWTPLVSFTSGLHATIQWTIYKSLLEFSQYLTYLSIISGLYLDFCGTQL